EQQAKTPRDFDLVRGSTRFMYASVEWRVTARKPIDRECPRDDRGCEQGFRSKQPVERERQAQLSSIDERETFFCLERDRCEARRIAYGSTFEALIAAERLAFADQAQRDVRERSEVAGCADRAARRNDRQHVVLEQGEQRLYDFGSCAGEACSEGIRFQEQDEPHDRARQRVADAARVAAHQVQLQLTNLLGGNALVREC